jgi:hypothetical protein
MEERFSEPEPNLITSTEGFSVRVLGRTGLLYQEGERSMWIDSEVLATPRTIATSKDSIKHWDTPDDGLIDDVARDRIADNMKRAFEGCGYFLEVHEPFDWDTVAIRRPAKPSE